jgi:Enolase, C-terminal TIM barrel domain
MWEPASGLGGITGLPTGGIIGLPLGGIIGLPMGGISGLPTGGITGPSYGRDDWPALWEGLACLMKGMMGLLYWRDDWPVYGRDYWPALREGLLACLQEAGYEGKVKIGMDVAASEFYKDGKYDLDFKNKNGDASKVLTGCVRPPLPASSFAQSWSCSVCSSVRRRCGGLLGVVMIGNASAHNIGQQGVGGRVRCERLMF